MSPGRPITAFVLSEFRLRDADSGPAAAEIVAAFGAGMEPAVPLLTSIDDRRDVAFVRALHGAETTDPAERAALDPLVASWQAIKRYGPRIAERSESPPGYYRLAVTESGINDSAGARGEPRMVDAAGDSVPISLLWIGAPAGSAGMLVLLGNEERPASRPDPREWPLPLSARLGVRVYEMRAYTQRDGDGP